MYIKISILLKETGASESLLVLLQKNAHIQKYFLYF